MTTATQIWPDEKGRFGPYGGRYVPETLVAPLEELEHAYGEARRTPSFRRNSTSAQEFCRPPYPAAICFAADRASRRRAHLSQARRPCCIPARTRSTIVSARACWLRMGKRRIIAETGAGQHGVATATVAARLGLECVVYMGTEDMERQRLNVFRMRLLGAEVVGVNSGTRTLKDAINEAMRDWVTNVRTTHYLLGSVLGAHPYPMMVRDFHRVIGVEARAQILEAEARLPDLLVACVGGGSNAIGLFHAFLDHAGVKLLGVEAGGRGPCAWRARFARMAAAAGYSGARPGVLQGTYSYVLQTPDGQIASTHSVSAGLDYPAIGPEHAWLAD
jgi:tryptophan synthase beta chain